MPVEDLVELEKSPEPQCQPDVAELPWIGPSHGFQADADEVRVVRRGNPVVVREKTELPIFALLVVEPDGALPVAFLIVVKLSEVGDDALSRPGLGANAFNESVVDVRLAVLGSAIASQEHSGLPAHR